MTTLEQRLFDLGRMDLLARQDTAVHRLDPRAKLVATLGFIAVVASFEAHALTELLPFLAYPIALAGFGNVSVRYLLRKAVYVLPFVLFIGIFNPLFEPQVVFRVGPLAVSAGWISCASLVARGLLAVLGALALLAVTGMGNVCAAFEKLGMPRVLATQLLLLYRYLFVLAHDVARMARARSMRSVGNAGMGLSVYGSVLGHLLLRTLDRAERIHLAMRCRGFDGQVRGLSTGRWRVADTLFILGCAACFYAARRYDLTLLLGQLATRLGS
ncbi:MAG: cobalt ECF transporter T component CbiQ [Myxococcota bacterium]|jgi:cobalt/nickel transport system permease protein|nr:cobalt ECF transporter T component CbiQ [Myxococcota bacterium]